MRIINTSKLSRLNLSCICLSLALCILSLVSGCEKPNTQKAQKFAQKSFSYYDRAVAQYKGLINSGKGSDKIYFELGYLYYQHGEFEKAAEEFCKSNIADAKKFLPIAYYRADKFSDALDIFEKNNINNNEYLYYYGLTCEKLNLYDKALEAYRKIRSSEFASLASGRIHAINKETLPSHIRDIDPDIDKIINSSPTQENYPQAGALVLSCDEKIVTEATNSQTYYLHFVVKILNQRGKESFSETKIGYDSTYEKIELDYARTIKPDGKVVEVGSRHIRDVSKYLNFPLYSNARVFIISFPEITEGSVIEYKLKIHSNKLINEKDFALSYPLQTTEPVIKSTFRLELPRDRAMNIRVLNEKYNNFNAALSPKIEKGRGVTVYSWEFKDIPQIIPEPNMPPEVEINPTLLVSTFNSWDEIHKWWWGLAKDKIKSDEAIKNKVNELMRPQKTAEDKVRAIYNFCAQNIRYVAVEYGQAGYEPHKAEDIFKNKYGDCKDQAILLVTMLKEAGFISWPVLIPTKEYYNLNKEYPSMLFNHCIAAVELEGKIIFLDPTAETCSFGDLPTGDQNRQVLLCKDKEYQVLLTPMYFAEHNKLENYLSIDVNSDESIIAKKRILTFGAYDQAQRRWLLYTTPELIEEALKEKIQEVSIGARLDKYDINNLNDLNKPIELSYSFSGPEYFTVSGILRSIPPLSSLDTSIVAKDKRKYPIDFYNLDSRIKILEIAIPPNFVIKYIPEDLKEENAWFNLNIEYKHKNNEITFSEKMLFKSTVVTQEDYPEFKNVFQRLAKKIKQSIVLEEIR